MNKDAILATFIGFIFGLVITSLILFGPSVVQKLPEFKNFKFALPNVSIFKKSDLIPAGIKLDPKPNVRSATTLSVKEPKDGSIAKAQNVDVSGETVPNSIILVSGGQSDQVTQADKSGRFKIQVKLYEGKNDLSIARFSPDSQESDTVTVFYTSEKF